MKTHIDMKCTDFYKREEELKRIAIHELRNAVNAHGGKFQWVEDEDGNITDGSERPCVCVLFDSGPEDVTISEVSYDDENGWRFIGETTKWSEDVSFTDPFDICSAFHIQTVTEMIPETESVCDATEKQPQPVGWLSHEDLLQRGFDPSGVTNEQLQEIASRMGDTYLDYGYWDDMEEACSYLEIPTKEETEKGGES